MLTVGPILNFCMGCHIPVTVYHSFYGGPEAEGSVASRISSFFIGKCYPEKRVGLG